MTRLFTFRKQAGLLVALLATTVVGCGSSETKPVPVEGTVKMGGQPLPEADVTFQPENGRPSIGTTDAEGRYKLVYTTDSEGAVPGKYKVFITTYVEPDSDYDPPDRRAGRPEQVPEQYNVKSSLEVTVLANQSDPIDFTLDSEGEIYDPDVEAEE